MSVKQRILKILDNIYYAAFVSLKTAAHGQFKHGLLVIKAFDIGRVFFSGVWQKWKIKIKNNIWGI